MLYMYENEIRRQLMKCALGSCYQSIVDLISPTPPMNEVLIKRAFHSLTALYIHENEIGRQLMMARLRKKWLVWLNTRGGGALPIMDYTGRLRPKGVPFSSWRTAISRKVVGKKNTKVHVQSRKVVWDVINILMINVSCFHDHKFHVRMHNEAMVWSSEFSPQY